MMTNTFLNNCQFGTRSAEYISFAVIFLQFRIRIAVGPSYHLLYTRSIPALYLLYICSISACILGSASQCTGDHRSPVLILASHREAVFIIKTTQH